MTTIDEPSQNIPPEASPQRVPRITLIIHQFPEERSDAAPAQPPRWLQEVYPPKMPTPLVSSPAPRRRNRGGRHHLKDRSWLGLMERILHSWPITLRVAVLLAVLFTGTVVLAVVLGVAGQLLLAVLGLRTQQQRRQRLDALRDETSQIEESGDS